MKDRDVSWSVGRLSCACAVSVIRFIRTSQEPIFRAIEASKAIVVVVEKIAHNGRSIAVLS